MEKESYDRRLSSYFANLMRDHQTFINQGSTEDNETIDPDVDFFDNNQVLIDDYQVF